MYICHNNVRKKNYKWGLSPGHNTAERRQPSDRIPSPKGMCVCVHVVGGCGPAGVKTDAQTARSRRWAHSTKPCNLWAPHDQFGSHSAWCKPAANSQWKLLFKCQRACMISLEAGWEAFSPWPVQKWILVVLRKVRFLGGARVQGLLRCGQLSCLI